MSLNGPDHFKKHLFGTIPTDDGKNINRSRLPTVKQTLLCYLANYDHGNTTQRDAVNATVAQVSGGAILWRTSHVLQNYSFHSISTNFIATRERKLRTFLALSMTCHIQPTSCGQEVF